MFVKTHQYIGSIWQQPLILFNLYIWYIRNLIINVSTYVPQTAGILTVPTTQHVLKGEGASGLSIQVVFEYIFAKIE